MLEKGYYGVDINGCGCIQLEILVSCYAKKIIYVLNWYTFIVSKTNMKNRYEKVRRPYTKVN